MWHIFSSLSLLAAYVQLVHGGESIEPSKIRNGFLLDELKNLPVSGELKADQLFKKDKFLPNLGSTGKFGSKLADVELPEVRLRGSLPPLKPEFPSISGLQSAPLKIFSKHTDETASNKAATEPKSASVEQESSEASEGSESNQTTSTLQQFVDFGKLRGLFQNLKDTYNNNVEKLKNIDFGKLTNLSSVFGQVTTSTDDAANSNLEIQAMHSRRLALLPVFGNARKRIEWKVRQDEGLIEDFSYDVQSLKEKVVEDVAAALGTRWRKVDPSSVETLLARVGLNGISAPAPTGLPPQERALMEVAKSKRKQIEIIRGSYEQRVKSLKDSLEAKLKIPMNSQTKQLVSNIVTHGLYSGNGFLLL